MFWFMFGLVILITCPFVGAVILVHTIEKIRQAVGYNLGIKFSV